MEIRATCELPFKWCGVCADLDLITTDEYSVVAGPKRTFRCRHEATCGSCERARQFKEAFDER